MFIVTTVLEFLFFHVCGWVGHIVPKAMTLGRVDLEWGESSEAPVAEVIGFGVLLASWVVVTVLWR